MSEYEAAIAEIDAEHGQVDESTSPAQEDKPILGGLTETQISALLAKAGRVDEIDDLKKHFESEISRVFGKFGEVQRDLGEIRKQEEAVKRFIPDTIRSRLEEYSPELAEILNEIPAIAPEIPAQADLGQFREGLFSDIQKEIARAVIGGLRPTWQKDLSTDGFKLFEQTLTPEERKDLLSTWDPQGVLGYLNRYDKWRSQAAKESRRLGGSVELGSGGGRDEEDEDMESFYQSLRR